MRTAGLCVALWGAAACSREASSLDGASGTGAEGSDGGSPDGSSDADTGELPEDPDFPEPGTLGPQGLRRQTLAELSNTLQSILDVHPDELADLLAKLPDDARTPFDTDYLGHSPSQPLVEGMVAMAADLSALFTSDPARRDALMGCTPSTAGDEACLRQFVTTIGRRALRRPLSSAEVDAYAAFISEAEEDDDFDVAFELVLTALLMDGEFLYLYEVGEPTADPNTLRLNDFEMASRLSFLLWGSAPDDALLDRADDGSLSTQSGIRDTALLMLDDPRSTAQLARLHAMWLSYDNLAVDPQLAVALRNETDMLVERVVTDGHWLNLFTASQTFLDDTLAAHYDIPLPGGQPGWVDYPDIRRGGLLSHGSFLALGKKFSDTSPTERGKAVWTRLLCQGLPPPPPDVDTGIPPTGGPNACKAERYNMRAKAECAACHIPIDGIGFGLENYGPAGEWRTKEPGNPDCSIDGYGDLSGREFAGPKALGELLIETGELQGCFARHLYQFVIGRTPEPVDQAAVEALTGKFEASDDLEELIVTFVASDAFRHRVTLEVQ